MEKKIRAEIKARRLKNHTAKAVLESDWMAESIRLGRIEGISNQKIASAIREAIGKVGEEVLKNIDKEWTEHTLIAHPVRNEEFNMKIKGVKEFMKRLGIK